MLPKEGGKLSRSSVFLLAMLVLAFSLLLPTAAAKVITVGPPGSGADYTSIQEAVNNAEPRDTILVLPGTYSEDVTVNVDSLFINASVTAEDSVTLKGHFVVEARNVTIANFVVNATPSLLFPKLYAVRFTESAQDCRLVNSTLLFFGAQVDSGASNITVQNCLILLSLKDGVTVHGSGCRIEKVLILLSPINPAYSPFRGICLDGASNAVVSMCGVAAPLRLLSYTGILVKNSENCMLRLCAVAINQTEHDTISIKIQDSSGLSFKEIFLVTYNVSFKELPNVTSIIGEFNFSQLSSLSKYIVTLSNVSFTPSGDLEMRSSFERVAPPEDYLSTLSYLDIAGSGWLYINFSYLPLREANESTYAVWMYDGSWHESGWNGSRTLDTSKNIVGVNITSLSSSFKTYAVLAKKLVENFTLELYPGWNLVSIPVDKEFTPEQLFEGCHVSYKVYAWNPESKEYYTPDVLQPGQGYWIYVSSDVSIPIKGSVLCQHSLSLSEGWNLIGSASNPAALVEKNAQCYPILWTWLPEKHSYTQALVIEPASGYWIYAFTPGSVEIISP